MNYLSSRGEALHAVMHRKKWDHAIGDKLNHACSEYA